MQDDTCLLEVAKAAVDLLLEPLVCPYIEDTRPPARQVVSHETMVPLVALVEAPAKGTPVISY